VFLHSSERLLFHQGYNFFGALIRSASSTGVSLFVMISGYFLLSNPKNMNCSYFYQKRLKKIGIPLLFWSFFYFSLLLLKNGEIGLNWNDWLDLLYRGVPGLGYHLWYLYMLLGLYTITPFILTIYKNYSNKVALSICTLLYSSYFIQSFFLLYSTGASRNYLFAPLLSIGFIPYFVFGKYYGDKLMTNDVFRQDNRKITMITSIIIFTIVSLFEAYLCKKIDMNWILCNLSPLVAIQVVSVYSFILSLRIKPCEAIDKLLNWASSLTFGIYLFHPVFLGIFFVLFRRLLQCEATVLTSALIAVLVFLVSAFSTAIFKKIPYLRECV